MGMAGMRALLALAFALVALPSNAQDWQVRSLGAASPSVFAERCQRPSEGLPDGCVASGSGDVRAA